MPYAWVAAPIMLAATLVFSAITKLGRSDSTLAAMESLGVPKMMRIRAIAQALPWVELIIALGLVASTPGVHVFFTIAALALFSAYWALVAWALTKPAPAECGCFGEVGSSEVTKWTLVRNTVLLALSLVSLIGSLIERFWGTILADPVQAWWVVALATAVALTWLISAGSPSSISTHEGDVDDDDLEDYLRAPIPFASVTDSDDNTIMVRDLAREKARLLLFLNTGCSPCVTVAKHLNEWRDQMPEIGIHAVLSYRPKNLEQTHPEYAKDVLYEDSTKLGRLLGIAGTPSAILFGADGLTAGGPVAGAGKVISFVEEIRAQLAEAREPLDAETGNELAQR